MSQDERMHIIIDQKVTLDEDLNDNLILDIGGGGEGIINNIF